MKTVTTNIATSGGTLMEVGAFFRPDGTPLACDTGSNWRDVRLVSIPRCTPRDSVPMVVTRQANGRSAMASPGTPLMNCN
jgi:hypothetical protein